MKRVYAQVSAYLHLGNFIDWLVNQSLELLASMIHRPIVVGTRIQLENAL